MRLVRGTRRGARVRREGEAGDEVFRGVVEKRCDRQVMEGGGRGSRARSREGRGREGGRECSERGGGEEDRRGRKGRKRKEDEREERGEARRRRVGGEEGRREGEE